MGQLENQKRARKIWARSRPLASCARPHGRISIPSCACYHAAGPGRVRRESGPARAPDARAQAVRPPARAPSRSQAPHAPARTAAAGRGLTYKRRRRRRRTDVFVSGRENWAQMCSCVLRISKGTCVIFYFAILFFNPKFGSAVRKEG